MTEEFTIHEISLGFPHDKEMLVVFYRTMSWF